MTLYLGTFELERGVSHSIIFPCKDSSGNPITGMAANFWGQLTDIDGDSLEGGKFVVHAIGAEGYYHHNTARNFDTFATGGELMEVSTAAYGSSKYAIVNEVGLHVSAIVYLGGSPITVTYQDVSGLYAPYSNWTSDSFNGWHGDVITSAGVLKSSGHKLIDCNRSTTAFTWESALPVDTVVGDYIKLYNGYYQIQLLGKDGESFLASGDGRAIPFGRGKNEMMYFRIASKSGTSPYSTMEPVEFQVKLRPARGKKLITGWNPDFANGYIRGRISASIEGQLQSGTYDDPNNGTHPHDELRRLPSSLSVKVYDQELDVFSSEQAISSAPNKDGIYKVNFEPRLNGTSTGETETTLVDAGSASDLPVTDDLIIGETLVIKDGKYASYANYSSIDSTSRVITLSAPSGHTESELEAMLNEADSIVSGGLILYSPGNDDWATISSVSATNKTVTIESAMSSMTAGDKVNIGYKRTITDYASNSQTITWTGNLHSYSNLQDIGHGESPEYGHAWYSVLRSAKIGEIYRITTKATWGDGYIEDHVELETSKNARIAVRVNEIANAEDTGTQTVLFVGPVMHSGEVCKDLQAVSAILYNGAGEILTSWSLTKENTASNPDSTTGSWFDATLGVFHLIRTAFPVAEQDVLQLHLTVTTGRGSFKDVVPITVLSPL